MLSTYIIELPQENHTTEIFYACKACATHALGLVSGGNSYPATTKDFSCELHYEGICEDTPKGGNA